MAFIVKPIQLKITQHENDRIFQCFDFRAKREKLNQTICNKQPFNANEKKIILH